MKEADISLEEREAIFSRLRRYLWCMDTGNIDGVPANFTEDATIRDVTGKLWDRAAGGVFGFATYFLGGSDRPTGQHWIQHMSVQDAGGGAMLVISYWAGMSWDSTTDEKSIRLIGCYRDTMVKVDGNWLIAKKVIDPWNAATIQEIGPMI